MFNLLKNIAKPTTSTYGSSIIHPNPDIRETIETIGAVVKYATSDQEKEGRELGIKAAAKIYQPVLENLEIRQVKILAATDKEQSFFEGQAKSLRQQCAEYEQKTAELTEKIKKWSDTKKSSNIDKFLSSINNFGMFSGVSSVRGISSAIYDSWSLSDYLKNKMNEKREKFYKAEFEKQSLVWQDKIKTVRNNIVQSIKNLKSLKTANKEQIKYITGIVNEAIEEYCETFAKYNALNEMEN